MASKKVIIKMTKEEKEEFNKDEPEFKKPKQVKRKSPAKEKQENRELKKIEKESKNLPAEKDEGLRDIIYETSIETKYDLNWSYIRQRIFIFFVVPYRQYEKWFNDSFNSPKEILKNNDNPPPNLKTEENKGRGNNKPGEALPMEKKDLNKELYEPPTNPRILLKIKQIEADLKKLQEENQ